MLVFLSLVSLALAGEQTIAPSALPAAVTAAVQARVPGATITSASQEGKTYEAGVRLGDRKLDLAFSADGTWLEEEERVAAADLPAAVTATLANKWKGWTVRRAERSTTPKGTVIEVVVDQGERWAEVAMSEDGAVQKVEKGNKEEGEEEEGD